MQKKALFTRLQLRVLLMLVALLALAWGVFLLMGPKLIEQMYAGESFGFLNNVIRGQDRLDLAYYIKLGYFFMQKLTICWAALFLTLSVIFICIHSLGFLFTIYTAITTLVLLEIVLALLFFNPHLLKPIPQITPLFTALYYKAFDVIQFNPECSEYNPEFTYLLKPGSCTFSNVEFSNDYSINRAGLRDDEGSLNAPEVIVIGDSFAMGWGVDQDKSMTELLEKRLGMKVLNAAISSFGTVREVELLKTLDTSNLKYLIVQTCENDYGENEAYLANNNVLENATIEEYKARVQEVATRSRYFPGQLVLYSIQAFFDSSMKHASLERITPTKEYKAHTMLKLLSQLKSSDFNHAKLILVNFDDRKFSYGIEKSIEKQVKKEIYPEFIRNAKVVKTRDRIHDEKNYFVFDNHINSAGHVVIADILYEAISEDLNRREI